MAVEYINGQYYNVPGSPSDGLGYYMSKNYIGTKFGLQPISPPPVNNGLNGNNGANGQNGNNIFSNASSGGASGTLQPYVNRMTQNANQALYGGLLGYQPQSLVAGNAGGTPVNSTPPQWRLPSAIPTPNQGQIGLLGPQAGAQQPMGIFGNRSWMEA